MLTPPPSPSLPCIAIRRYIGRCRHATGRECAARGALPNATAYLATTAGLDVDLLTLPR